MRAGGLWPLRQSYPARSRLSRATAKSSRVLYTCPLQSTISFSLKSLKQSGALSALTPRADRAAMGVDGHSRAHSGHSHHHHHHDNTYLTSTNKHDAGVKVTRLGLYVNLGMAISKGIGGYFFNSQALVADAFHALTDLVSDFMTLATISVALKPPTAIYPNGFGKVESFGSLFVSGLLLTGGFLMAQHAGLALFHQLFPDLAHHAVEAVGHSHGFMGHSHSHSAAETIPNINAAWLAAGSIVIKEYLYRISWLPTLSFTANTNFGLAMKVARERKSSVLASNAVHHRVDSLTSIVALIAIGGSHLLNGATWLDPVGGLIVSLMVIQAGFGNSVAAIYELCDRGVDEEIKNAVRRATEKAIPSEAVNIGEIQGIKAGQNYLMEIQLVVPNTWTLEQLKPVEDAVRSGVGSKVRGVRRIRVRFVSQDGGMGDFNDEFIGADVSPRSSPEPEAEEEHNHNHHRNKHHHHQHP